MGRRLFLRRRRDGGDRARVSRAGERRGAVRAAQAAAGRACDREADAPIRLYGRHHRRDAGCDARDYDEARELTAPAHTESGAASLIDRRLPPVTEIGAASMIAIAAGVIYLAAYLPKHAPLGVAVALLALAAALQLTNAILLFRLRDFAWDRFFQVGGWALLAYAVIAGMIEYAFVFDTKRSASPNGSLAHPSRAPLRLSGVDGDRRRHDGNLR